jgi:hypothetical protein
VSEADGIERVQGMSCLETDELSFCSAAIHQQLWSSSCAMKITYVIDLCASSIILRKLTDTFHILNKWIELILLMRSTQLNEPIILELAVQHLLNGAAY